MSPKILTKDLSHPHFVFPTLSFVLSLAPSLRRRKGDDIAPSAVKKDAVLFLFFPHMSMQLISSVCPILISERFDLDRGGINFKERRMKATAFHT